MLLLQSAVIDCCNIPSTLEFQFSPNRHAAKLATRQVSKLIDSLRTWYCCWCCHGLFSSVYTLVLEVTADGYVSFGF